MSLESGRMDAELWTGNSHSSTAPAPGQEGEASIPVVQYRNRAGPWLTASRRFRRLSARWKSVTAWYLLALLGEAARRRGAQRAERASALNAIARTSPSVAQIPWPHLPEWPGDDKKGRKIRKGKDDRRHGHHEGESVFAEFVEEVVLCPRILFCEISTVVVLSTLFESWEHWMRHRMASGGDRTGGRIMDALFKEFTGLGFIGVFLYLVTQSGVADVIAAKLFGDALSQIEAQNPLAESFETVHMMIFLLLVVLLVQAFAMWKVTGTVVETWGLYERTRAFGTRNTSLESMFVEAGYLQRLQDQAAPRGTDLKYKRPFTYKGPVLQRLLLYQDTLQNLVMWRAIRHEFIFPRAGPPDEREEHNGLGHGNRRGGVPNPGQFSFEAYLRYRLSGTVVKLVEVDVWTWFFTMLLLIPLVYGCLSMTHEAVELVQCSLAWTLLAAAVVLAYLLEEETLQLTPRVPKDARQILRLFSGTATQNLRRQSFTSQTQENGMRAQTQSSGGAPGLGGCERTRIVQLGTPPALAQRRGHHRKTPQQTWTFMAPQTYSQLFELLNFWQAIGVTCLVFLYLSQPIRGLDAVTLYLLAWLEWPIMMFYVMPVVLQRLTLRGSIGDETDEALLRVVTLEAKEAIVRYHVLIVQLMGFERRAAQHHDAWALWGGEDLCDAEASPDGIMSGYEGQQSPPLEDARSRRPSRAPTEMGGNHAAWTNRDAYKTWRRGNQIFRGLPHRDRQEIEEIFEVLDCNNDEQVSAQELSARFEAMGFSGDVALEAAEALLRCVDYDGSAQLTWSKFQAVAALATSNRLTWELQEDFCTLFSLIDTQSKGRITVFELTGWLQNIKSGMTEVDVASLLYRHFGQAKPTVSRHEFVEWLQAIGTTSSAIDTNEH